MYKRILIPMENSATDEVILGHIVPLARLMNSDLFLVHVADGWAARNFDALKLAESAEMQADRAYLEATLEKLRGEGIDAQIQLLTGDPSAEIIRAAEENGVDLIAMGTHGHRFLGDMLYGSTADKVRHGVEIPVLMLKAPKQA